MPINLIGSALEKLSLHLTPLSPKTCLESASFAPRLVQLAACTAMSEWSFVCTQVLPVLHWYKDNGYGCVVPERYMAGRFRPEMQPQELWRRSIEVAGDVREFRRFEELEFLPRLEEYRKFEETGKQIGASLTLKVDQLHEMYRDPDSFQHFPRYELQMTRFGPGGTYEANNPLLGLIFVRYGGSRQWTPVQMGSSLALHETVHLLIENKIVRGHGPATDPSAGRLKHWIKERVVDLLEQNFIDKKDTGWPCKQPNGDKAVDEAVKAFLTGKTALKRSILDFVQRHPDKVDLLF